MNETSKTTKREQARAAQRERMAAAISQLQTSDGWKAWLQARKNFHSYSFHNQLLIACQNPQATLVRGYKQWRNDFNRQVQKGSKSLKILGFATRAARKNDDPGRIFEDAKGRKRVAYFPTLSVFDMADTKPIEGAEVIPINPPAAELTGDSHAWALKPLATMITDDLKLELVYGAEGESPEGWHLDGKQIGRWCDLEPNREVRVLVHEISHALGVDYNDYSRSDAEVICDTVAWLVCDSIGLDVSDSSIPYVAGWSQLAPERIEALAHVIDDNARKIEAVIGSRPDSGDLDIDKLSRRVQVEVPVLAKAAAGDTRIVVPGRQGT